MPPPVHAVTNNHVFGVCVPAVLFRFPQNKDSTGDEKLTAKALGDYYTKMTQDFPIVSIEDAFDQVRHCSLAGKILFFV